MQPGSPRFELALWHFLKAPTRAMARKLLREFPELADDGPAAIDMMIRTNMLPGLPGLTERQILTRLRVRRALLVPRRRRGKLIVALCVLAIGAGVGTFLLVNRNGPVPFGPAITVSPDGKLLAAAEGAGHISVWNVASRQVEATLTAPGATPSTIAALPAFSPGGTLLGAVGDNTTLYLWSVATRRLTAMFTDPQSAGVAGFAFSPDRRTLATFDGSDYVYLWDLASKHLIATLAPVPVHSGDYGVTSGVDFSADGKSLAVSLAFDNQYPSRPGAVIWDVATRMIVAKLPANTGGGGLAFSPDSTTLALGDEFGNVTLWSMPGKTVTRTLQDTASNGICEGGQGVVYSPDGTTLATDDGCANDSAFVWDPRSGQRVAVLNGQTRLGNGDLAFNPDGKTLFAGSVVGAVDLWDVASAKVTATLVGQGGG